jgi:uncharacterized Tic20 family protein
MNTNTTALYEPDSNERTMAVLAHVLILFAGFIGPLIILIVKQDSRFVKFHALNALLWNVVLAVFIVLILCCYFASFSGIVLSAMAPEAARATAGISFLGFGVFFLGIFAGVIATYALGIIYAIKANRGEWAGYPVIGTWAARIAGI